MEYDTKYINVKYGLIKLFLFNAASNILDISYNANDKLLEIQVVLLYGTNLPITLTHELESQLHPFKINLKEVFLSKDQFNESRGEWLPKYYVWLENVLFSKSEIL